MLTFYLKRMIKSKLFYICLGATVGILLFGATQIIMRGHERAYYNEPISILEALHSTMEFGGFYVVVAPALMSVLFLYFYTEDMEKRAIYYQMLRTNRLSYYAGQILSALCSSGLLIVISMLIFCVVCMAAGVVWEHNGHWAEIFMETNIGPYYYGPYSELLTVWQIVCIVFYSLPWPLVGLLVSLVTKNRYVIMASPFVVFLLWNYMAQFLWKYAHWLDWIKPTSCTLILDLPYRDFWTIQLTFLYPILYIIVFVGIVSSIYLGVTKRRYVREGL